jgi:hypothetical protein
VSVFVFSESRKRKDKRYRELTGMIHQFETRAVEIAQKAGVQGIATIPGLPNTDAYRITTSL